MASATCRCGDHRGPARGGVRSRLGGRDGREGRGSRGDPVRPEPHNPAGARRRRRVPRAPRCAPSYAQGCYDRDSAFYREWTAISRTSSASVSGCASGCWRRLTTRSTSPGSATSGGRPSRSHPRRPGRSATAGGRHDDAPRPRGGLGRRPRKHRVPRRRRGARARRSRAGLRRVGLPTLAVDLARRTINPTSSSSTSRASSGTPRRWPRASPTRCSCPGPRPSCRWRRSSATSSRAVTSTSASSERPRSTGGAPSTRASSDRATVRRCVCPGPVVRATSSRARRRWSSCCAGTTRRRCRRRSTSAPRRARCSRRATRR